MYDDLYIEGAGELEGRSGAPGSLQETIYLMCLALMARGQHRLANISSAAEVSALQHILEKMGLIFGDTRRYFMDIDSRAQEPATLTFQDTYQLKSAFLLIFPLLHAFGQATLYLPDSADKPWFMDELTTLLERFGARVRYSGGKLEAKCRYLKGAKVRLAPGESILSAMAILGAALARGSSLISQVSTASETVALCRALQKMGAMVEGSGSETLTIEGVNALAPLEYAIAPDNRHLLFLFFAALLTESTITLQDLPEEAKALLGAFSQEIGAVISKGANNDLIIEGAKLNLPTATFITGPYPDITLPALMLLGNQHHHQYRLVSSGLIPLSADLRIFKRLDLSYTLEGNELMVRSTPLTPTELLPTNARQAAWLLLATLATPGASVIHQGGLIDRRFSTLDLSLTRLGASIRRLKAGQLAAE